MREIGEFIVLNLREIEESTVLNLRGNKKEVIFAHKTVYIESWKEEYLKEKFTIESANGSKNPTAKVL